MLGLAKRALVGCVAVIGVLGAMRTEAKAAGGRLAEYAGYEVFNVTKYGADASGAKDSQRAFYNALGEAEEAQEQGNKAIVYIPSGTYTLKNYVAVRGIEAVFVAENDATVQADCAINLQKSGSAVIVGGTWKQISSASAKKTIFFGNDKANLELRDLKIVNPYKAVNVTGSVCKMDNVKVQGSPYIAVTAFQNSKLTVKKCNFQKNSVAVMVSGSTATISKTEIQKSKNMGLEAIEKAKVVVKSCKIKNNGSGYQIGKTENKGHGVGIYTGSVMTLKKTQIYNNNQCGISLVGANVNLDQCKLANNGRHGIGTREKCKVTAKKTTIDKNGNNTKESVNGHNGMILMDGSSATLTDCTVSNNKNTGIWGSGKDVSLTVKKCTFKGNRIYPIILDTDNGRISLVSDSCSYSGSLRGVRIHLAGSGQYKFTKKGKNIFKKIQEKEKFCLVTGNGVKSL